MVWNDPFVVVNGCYFAGPYLLVSVKVDYISFAVKSILFSNIRLILVLDNVQKLFSVSCVI